MKQAYVEAQIHEVKGKCNFVGRGKGSYNALAIHRAFEQVFAQVKGKRFQTVTATITLTTVPEDKGDWQPDREYEAGMAYASGYHD